VQEALLTAIKYLEQAEREHSAYCASSTVMIHQMVPHSLIPLFFFFLLLRTHFITLLLNVGVVD
jgi:hypothetical protein